MDSHFQTVENFINITYRRVYRAGSKDVLKTHRENLLYRTEEIVFLKAGSEDVKET